MVREELGISLVDMQKAVAATLTGMSRHPNVLTYKPHAKQERFHRSVANGRLYIGGNRSGKTVGGAVEAIWRMKGEHPFQKVPPPPTVGRIVTVDFKKGEQEIIVPKLKQLIPPSLLINGSWDDSYNSKYHILRLSNGSRAEIMSQEQELSSFAGTDRDWLWMDEECPKAIYKESIARLVDHNGVWWMTMTPLDGMTWVHDDIFVPYLNHPTDDYEVVTVDIAENPHIPVEGRVRFLAGLTDEERKIRGAGEFVALGGLLLKEFHYDKNVIEHIGFPSNWEIWISIDHGYRNPTAVLWHAVSPNGSVYTFHEHYKSEWTVSRHAAYINKYNEEHGITNARYVGDMAMTQREASTGLSIQQQYRNEGINVKMAKKGKGSVPAGLDKMNEYFRIGKWQISEHCTNFLKEIRKYRGKQFASSKTAELNNKQEVPQQKDDHAIDSARYFFTLMPKLGTLKPEEMAKVVANSAVAEIMQAGRARSSVQMRVYPWRMDPNFVRQMPRTDQLEYGEVL